MYVDGFNLYHGLRAQRRHAYLWLDLVALGKRLRPRSDLRAVKYFTAPVLDDPGAASRQAEYQNALTAKYPGQIQIIQGRYQKSAKRCRECGSEWVHREEKETDVNIAVSLVADAATHAMDSALIVSADSDLAPAVRTAKTLRPDLFIVAAFPPQRRSAELRRLMPASFPIKEARLKQSLLPDQVSAESGKVFNRPDKWR